MTRSENEIKSLFESMKGYSGGLLRRKKEVALTLLQAPLNSHWTYISQVDPSKDTWHMRTLEPKKDKGFLRTPLKQVFPRLPFKHCEENIENSNDDNDVEVVDDIYKDYPNKYATPRNTKMQEISLEESSMTSLEHTNLLQTSCPFTYDNLAIRKSSSSFQSRDLFLPSEASLESPPAGTQLSDAVSINEDVFEKVENNNEKNQSNLMRACSNRENKEIENILREAHQFSTLNRAKANKERSRLKLLRKSGREERRPFCENVKGSGAMSKEEQEAYEELVQKPHRIQRQHYSLSDSENLSVCCVEEVMVSRSDGCEMPPVDDQLRFLCESTRHISCHSLPTPEPPNNPFLSRQHSLPSYYESDPPPLPIKMGSKTNIPSSSIPFSNSSSFSFCPPRPLKHSSLPNFLPLPMKQVVPTLLSTSPPIPPKFVNFKKPTKPHLTHHFTDTESRDKHSNTNHYKHSKSNLQNISSSRPPEYNNQLTVEEQQQKLIINSPQPQIKTSKLQQTPNSLLRPLRLQFSSQPPLPTYSKQSSLTTQLPQSLSTSSPQQQLPPQLFSFQPPLPQLPPPQLPPPQLPPPELPPPQLPPPHLPFHRTLFTNCNLKTPLSLQHSFPSSPLNHTHSHQHHHLPKRRLSNEEIRLQMPGRYETSDSLVYEDVNLLRNISMVKDRL